MGTMKNINLKSSLKIGVVGLGLIGGSVLKSLHNQGYYVIGVSKSSHKEASKFSSVSSPEITAVKDCDVVFVCSRMQDTLKTLDTLENIVSKDCIVTDVSSLKRFVNFTFEGEEIKRPYKFVGSHPMAGTEFSGFSASFKDLFSGAKWILNSKCGILETLIVEMGAKPVIMPACLHDKFACLISHLPMLISTALMKTVLDEGKEALTIASSGFRDTTRLSLTDGVLASDMLELNSDNFDNLIEIFIQNLRELKNMPKAEFIKVLDSIQKTRKPMYDKDGKNAL